MSVAKSFEIFSVEICVGQILQKLLELAKISRTDYLIYIGVHYKAPVDTTLSRLKSELWR